MKGLLIKNALMMKRTLFLYAVLIVVLSFGNDSGLMFALFYSLMLPINIIALDERSHFDRLLPMLPLTSTQCVLDKYLFTYAGLVVMTAIACAIASVRAGLMAVLPLCLLGMGITLMAHALSIPLLIRFGVERGRLLYLLLFLGQAALLAAAVAAVGNVFDLGEIGLMKAGACLLLLGAALNAVSIRVAVKMYEKKALC